MERHDALRAHSEDRMVSSLRLKRENKKNKLPERNSAYLRKFWSLI